jgi:hypothetical protein
MSRDFLKRLEKVEKRMNPPEPPKIRIEVSFVRPDRTISSRMIIESGKPNVIIGEDENDEED